MRKKIISFSFCPCHCEKNTSRTDPKLICSTRNFIANIHWIIFKCHISALHISNSNHLIVRFRCIRIAVICVSPQEIKKHPQLCNIPVLRHNSDETVTAVLHGHIGIQTFCDGFGDDGQLIGFQFLDHFLLAGNDGVDLTTLTVEVIGALALFLM